MNYMTISLTSRDPECVCVMQHNDIPVYQGTISKPINLAISNCQPHNFLTIHVTDSWCQVVEITMFGMGSDYIKQQGRCVLPDGKQVSSDKIMKNIPWVLEYSYPVFAWLMPRHYPSWYYRFD